jgi:hypothetical protein
MTEINRSEPVWGEMNNIFRHFAIARSMRSIAAVSKMSWGKMILADYDVSDVKGGTPKHYLPFTKYLTHDTQGKKFTQRLCGGVLLIKGDVLRS